MFYSHDILTSREHGVATIWVVATLGSRSTLKKVGRRDILQVDVSRACKTICQSAAPMALRLQSNLLYGVSRVFSEQCSYVLGDVQTTTNTMRQLLRTASIAQLEIETVKPGRRENLLLIDDPAFDPSQILQDIDLAPLNYDEFSHEHSLRHISSPHTPFSSGSFPALIIPSSVASMDGVLGGLADFDPATSDLGRFPGTFRGSMPELIVQNDEGILPDADFSVDADGNLVEDDIAMPSLQDAAVNHGENEQMQASMEVLDAYALGQQEQHQIDTQHDSFRLASDDVAEMPILLHAASASNSRILSNSIHRDPNQSPEHAAARMSHRTRKDKPLGLDRGALELRNSDIAAWSNNYLANMREMKELKGKSRGRVSGKRNADFWTWKAGIGGIGLTASLRTFQGYQDPLKMFYGGSLHDWVLKSLTFENRKRSSDQLGDDMERHVRRRTGSLEIGRAVGDTTMDMEDLRFNGEEEEVELGRHAPTPLQGSQDYDLSSTMPWNISGGRGSRNQGSVNNIYRAGSRSSATPMPMPRRRQLQMQETSGASALPMPGHIASAEMSSRVDDQYRDLPEAFTFSLDDTESEYYGGAALVSTQIADKSQDLREMFDNESSNFVEFVKQAIFTRATTPGADAQSISFSALLPPASNTHIVAAQALLHSLSLATKGRLNVMQNTHFGDIWLSPCE